MRVNCVLDIDWDEEDITVEDIIDFLNNCGEDVNASVRVVKCVEGER